MMWGSRWVGGKFFLKKIWVGGKDKIKFPKKKLYQGEKKWEGAGGKKVGGKKTEMRAEKGQRKKGVSMGRHRDRKEKPISAPSIHGWCTGGCW